QRVVEADAQALGAEGLHQRPHQVLPPGRAGDLVVREVRVPEAEAVVVLGRDHDVAHPGLARGPGPVPRVEEVRIEVVEVAPVLLVGEPLAHLHPLVPGGQRVQPPVDEHPEPGLGPPAGVHVTRASAAATRTAAPAPGAPPPRRPPRPPPASRGPRPRPPRSGRRSCPGRRAPPAGRAARPPPRPPPAGRRPAPRPARRRRPAGRAAPSGRPACPPAPPAGPGRPAPRPPRAP